jgi:hypothetical protein
MLVLLRIFHMCRLKNPSDSTHHRSNLHRSICKRTLFHSILDFLSKDWLYSYCYFRPIPQSGICCRCSQLQLNCSTTTNLRRVHTGSFQWFLDKRKRIEYSRNSVYFRDIWRHPHNCTALARKLEHHSNLCEGVRHCLSMNMLPYRSRLEWLR